ncbi:MAG: UDP-2,3-diacylglucosamine diphosphatase [Bacteriovoracaceae bacterium]
MSFVSLSDVHVKNPQDDRYRLLLKFFKHEATQKADQVFLLGDIFDLMVGPYPEYYQLYSEFFNELVELVRKGKVVHYFEGNHDLHIKNLFRQLLKKENLSEKLLVFHREPWTTNFQGKSYYFSHGDELEPGNYSYKIYKQVLMSKPIEFIIGHIAPYSLIEAIGTNASKLSKKNGKRSYNEDKNRSRFRQGATYHARGIYDFIVAGHSHIKENIELKSTDKAFHYINNGFFPEQKTFIQMEYNQVKFISLV